MTRTVLLLSPLREASGNKSTALRIGTHFKEPDYRCIVKSPKQFVDDVLFQQFIQENGVDVILAIHAVHCARLLKGCHKPYVIIFGGTDLNCSEEFCDKLHAVSDVVINARFLVCFSETMYTTALRLWPGIATNKLEIIPQGIPVNRTLSTSTGHNEISITQCLKPHMTNIQFERLKTSKCFQYFTLVAGIRAVKDPMFLLDAFSEWHSRNQNIYLIIVGPILDECLGKTFTSKVKTLPGICYLGSLSLSDTHSVILRSAGLLNASISEGMCLSILEAMALSVPVVARDIAGNRSIVQDGKTGLLYSTAKECVERCKTLLENPELAQRMVTEAKAMVDQNHDHDQEGKAYVDIIANVFAESQSQEYTCTER